MEPNRHQSTNPAKPQSAAAAAQEFLFYGATRFERPEIGRTFWRDGKFYLVTAINQENRNFLRPFDRVWEFVTACEEVPQNRG